MPGAREQLRRDGVDVERPDRADRGEDRPILPEVRITLAPVGWAGSTWQPLTSMPRPVIASSMNRPNASSPTTPANATERPRRAAPQAKIADELPTVIEIEPTIRSTWPNAGTGSGSDDHDVRVDLAEHEDVEVAGGGGSHRQ